MTWLSGDASTTLQIMAEAALLAGQGLMAAAQDRTRLSITEKTAGDFVSEADHQAEETLSVFLAKAFPGYGWLGEETVERESQVDGLRWIVDPLDGTTNFLKGLPHWAVSLALYQHDTPLCAIIYDPAKRELFSAERGHGAFLNGQPIRVSQGTAPSNALLATGVPAGGRVRYLPQCLSELEHTMPLTAGVRRWGAASLDLAYVAAARLDAYWERNLGTWDIAAGVLIVEEAGGQVLPLWADEPLLSSGSFVAGEAAMVGWLRAQLNRNR